MSTTAFSPLSSKFHGALSNSTKFIPTAMTNDNTQDRRTSNAVDGSTALLLRRLPPNTTNEAVRTMLLFAKDLQDTELVATEFKEDLGFATALARFSNATSASEAQAMLNGKPNTAGQANMIVDVVTNSTIGNGTRRPTLNSGAARGASQSLSPPPTNMPKASRFNGTFQTIETISPPLAGSQLDHNGTDSSVQLQKIFSPQSPVGSNIQDRSRVTGKSVIDEETGDDETGELLKDPLAYMKGDGPTLRTGPRSMANSRMPVNAFNALSLNTNMNATSPNPYVSPRSAIHMHPQSNAFSPGGHPFQATGNQYLRHNYPPVNPADQNPPCNTLYVGNLPMDTSEDELKAMFSKQRGYKRLCFRTKQNGPMCFVEFEDISFATKALNELYGVQLHNSVKGGIRLSFSKNPLGVRSGQPGSGHPVTPLSATTPGMNGFSPLSPGAFSTANGPPPGLSVPPGLNMGSSMSPPLSNGHFASPTFPIGSPGLHGGRLSHIGNGTVNGHGNGIYPDYMLGR